MRIAVFSALAFAVGCASALPEPQAAQSEVVVTLDPPSAELLLVACRADIPSAALYCGAVVQTIFESTRTLASTTEFSGFACVPRATLSLDQVTAVVIAALERAKPDDNAFAVAADSISAEWGCRSPDSVEHAVLPQGVVP